MNDSPSAPDKTAQLKLRFHEDLRRRLAEAAEAEGLSLNSAIVRRLEQSLVLEADLGGANAVQLFRTMAGNLKAVGVLYGDWRSDWMEFARLRVGIIRFLDAHQPPPERLNEALQDLLRAQADGDEAAEQIARSRAHEEQERLSEWVRKTRIAMNASADMVLGVSLSDRRRAEQGLAAVERLLAGSTDDADGA